MPSNKDFVLEILVGGVVVPEYEKDGQVYIESNLSTPVSYKKQVSELVGTEVETQAVPVTPYQIRLKSQQHATAHYYKIYVDGVKVKGISLHGGQNRLIQGFKDGTVIREFLFSLPRFPRDEHDRISGQRCQAIGKVEVECWNAVHTKSKFALRKQKMNFEQASKKDCRNVTKGQYTMVTSTPGQVVTSRSLYRNADYWHRTSLQSKLSVQYHMATTLQDMGFTLQPLCIPHLKLTNPPSVKTKNSSPASNTRSRKLLKFSRCSNKRKDTSDDATASSTSKVSTSKTVSDAEGPTEAKRTSNVESEENSPEVKVDPDVSLNSSAIQVIEKTTEPAPVVDLTCDSDEETEKTNHSKRLGRDSGIEMTPLTKSR